MRKTFLFVFSLFLVNNIFAATSSKNKTLAEEVQALQQDVQNLKENKLGRLGQEDFGFISLSPYAEIQTIYSPYSLIVKILNVNEDLQLLQQKQEIASYRAAHNIMVAQRPLVMLSGSLEAQVWHKRDYTGGGKSDINLSHAELDVAAELTPWITAAMFSTYDDAAPTSGARVTNSQLRVDTGFVNVGNLDKTPWYGTIGQIYVPFGQYNNYMVTDPWTKILARTKERAAVVGYSKDGWSAALYGFKGDTYTSDRNSIVNNGGANLYYKTTWHEMKMSVGTSYIYNLADSIGLMSNGDATSGHFTGFKSAENIDHAVPAIDLRGALTYSDYNFLSEYINAVKSFKYTDLGFNGKGASPQALDIEANYNFKIMDKTSSAAIGYDRTWEALAANLPKHTAFIEFATEWFKSTIESIEYRHDWNYSKSDTATGGGVAAYSPDGAKTRNLITAQVGVYL